MDLTKDIRSRIESGQISCMTELTLALIGSKWKLTILWHLGIEGTKRFSEIQKMIPYITQKVLVNQLRQLEEDRLITFEVYTEVPPSVEYMLTPYGESLVPILEMIHEWGKSYGQQVLWNNEKP